MCLWIEFYIPVYSSFPVGSLTYWQLWSGLVWRAIQHHQHCDKTKVYIKQLHHHHYCQWNHALQPPSQNNTTFIAVSHFLTWQSSDQLIDFKCGHHITLYGHIVAACGQSNWIWEKMLMVVLSLGSEAISRLHLLCNEHVDKKVQPRGTYTFLNFNRILMVTKTPQRNKPHCNYFYNHKDCVQAWYPGLGDITAWNVILKDR